MQIQIQIQTEMLCKQLKVKLVTGDCTGSPLFNTSCGIEPKAQMPAYKYISPLPKFLLLWYFLWHWTYSLNDPVYLQLQCNMLWNCCSPMVAEQWLKCNVTVHLDAVQCAMCNVPFTVLVQNERMHTITSASGLLSLQVMKSYYVCLLDLKSEHTYLIASKHNQTVTLFVSIRNHFAHLSQRNMIV